MFRACFSCLAPVLAAYGGSVNACGEFECRGIGFAIKTGLMHIPRQVVTQ